MTTQMKPSEQYFHVVLFIILCEVVLNFLYVARMSQFKRMLVKTSFKRSNLWGLPRCKNLSSFSLFCSYC